MRLLRIASLCGLLTVAALQAQTAEPKATWPINDAPAGLHDAVADADLIVVTLHDALRRELTGALAQGGPAFAVNSCHVDVVGMTRRIGRRPGVSAGRTSDRLRNPANAPPDWAAPLVHATGSRRAREGDGYVVDLGSSVGVLRPIVHQPMCSSCHGPAAALDPAVRAKLATRYPADQATGFLEGQIRGWFWVQVPKTRPQ